MEENTHIRAETLKYVHEKQNPVEKDHLEKGLEYLTLEYLGAKSQRKGCKKLRKWPLSWNKVSERKEEVRKSVVVDSTQWQTQKKATHGEEN